MKAGIISGLVLSALVITMVCLEGCHKHHAGNTTTKTTCTGTTCPKPTVTAVAPK